MGMGGRHFPLPNMCKLQPSVVSRGSQAPETPTSGDLGVLGAALCWPLPNSCRFLQAIFFGGIDVSIRGEVWPFLLRYYSHESTSEEREVLRVQKRKEYAEIQQKR